MFEVLKTISQKFCNKNVRKRRRANVQFVDGGNFTTIALLS